VVSKTEETVARSLYANLEGLADGASMGDSDDFQNVLAGLEYYLPAVLGEVHQEWRYESMDGFQLAVARKTGPREAELIGLCILISDQTLTPIHVRLRTSASGDEIEWLTCKVGEAGDGKGGMVRVPYHSDKGSKRLFTVVDRLDSIDWVYSVGFGEGKSASSNDGLSL